MDVIENPWVLDKIINASLFVLQSGWLQEMYIYIRKFLEGYSTEQWKKMVLKALPFTIINEKLYKQGQDQILCWCFHDDKILIILHDMQEGVSGRHFSIDIIARKVLDAKYGAQFYTRMHISIVNPVMHANWKFLTYPNGKTDHHVPSWTIHEMGFELHWPH